jgi:hypothetical protein
MKRFDPRIVFGLLLLIGGSLALLQTMGYLRNMSDIILGGMFIAVGLIFLALVMGGHWWGVFPGFVMLAIGGLLFLPKQLNELGGAIFLGGIALAFWVSFVTDRQERWWALIPAGVLTTLAGVTIVSDRFGGFGSGGFFFLGLAITFLLVAVLAGMRWAYWPAAALGGMSVLLTASQFELINYIWAAVLIAAGGFLLFRYFSRR